MNKKILNKTLFFSLVLILFLSSFSNLVLAKNINLYSMNDSNIHYIDDNDIELISTSTGFSANSNIGILIPKNWVAEKPEWWDVAKWGKYPDRVRFYLKNPYGETKYMIDQKTEVQETQNEWHIYLGEIDLRIPAFPDIGTWRVEIFIYSLLGQIENPFTTIPYGFTVGESSIMDNLMAPIYLYFDIFGVFGSGDEITFALPGIFFLSMIIWIPMVFIFLIWYTRTSVSIGKSLFKKSYGGKKQNV